MVIYNSKQTPWSVQLLFLVFSSILRLTSYFKPIISFLVEVPETGEPGPIDGGHPCHYDEGSPLIQEVRDASGRPFNGIVGIMSKTLGCDLANQKNPTVFTRLSAYYAWLFRIAGAQPAPAK